MKAHGDCGSCLCGLSVRMAVRVRLPGVCGRGRDVCVCVFALHAGVCVKTRMVALGVSYTI